ncbi:acetolactate synthase large subunit [Streptomyces sp. PmtG]
MVNVVGEHALRHKRLDAPLESDIQALARTVSRWTRCAYDAGDLAADAADAVAAAVGPPGGVATLVVPADVAWANTAAKEPGSGRRAAGPRGLVSGPGVAGAAAALRSGEPAALLLGGAATHGAGLRAAARVAAATGARLLCETFPARLERGAGLPPVERLGYRAADAAGQLSGVRHLVLAGASVPVPFFAYPGHGAGVLPDGCEALALAPEGAGQDVAAALRELVAAVGADSAVPVAQAAGRPGVPGGALTAQTAAAVIGTLLPEGAVVVDEANTSGLWLPGATAGAPPHDWLTLTGGALGQGLPLAVGAAVAEPERPVVALVADGAAMYTLPALWTQAREGLNVTTVVFSNRAYAILGLEQAMMGGAVGAVGRELFDLGRPDLDFVALARGMGVAAGRASTVEGFAALVERGLGEAGPFLVECVVPPIG